jgi:putative flippase GtrA
VKQSGPGGSGRANEAIIPPKRKGTAISVTQLGARAIGDHRIRYLIVGAGTNALYFGLFWLGWHLLDDKLPYLVVTAAANLSTAVIAYSAYRTFVFGSTTGWLRGFPKFYTVFLLGLACSLLGMPLLIKVLGSPVLLAQAIVIAIVPFISYLLHRFWTFADKPST